MSESHVPETYRCIILGLSSAYTRAAQLQPALRAPALAQPRALLYLSPLPLSSWVVWAESTHPPESRILCVLRGVAWSV